MNKVNNEIYKMCRCIILQAGDDLEYINLSSDLCPYNEFIYIYIYSLGWMYTKASVYVCWHFFYLHQEELNLKGGYKWFFFILFLIFSPFLSHLFFFLLASIFGIYNFSPSHKHINMYVKHHMLFASSLFQNQRTSKIRKKRKKTEKKLCIQWLSQTITQMKTGIFFGFIIFKYFHKTPWHHW